MHASLTAPFIDEILGNGSSLSWIFNILDRKKEVDRILYEDRDEVFACCNNLSKVHVWIYPMVCVYLGGAGGGCLKSSQAFLSEGIPLLEIDPDYFRKKAY